MAAEEIEIGPTRALLHGDEVVGALAVRPEYEAAVTAAVEGAGYSVAQVADDAPATEEAPLAEPTGPRIDLDVVNCTVEEHLPCDVKIGISVAVDVSRDLGLPIHGTLAQIQERGYTSLDEARHVLQAWSDQVRSAPAADEDQLNWADIVVSEVFTPEPETAP